MRRIPPPRRFASPPLLPRGGQFQSGAAILIAMLVVTLVATFAAGLQWRQWRVLQQEAAARAQSQAAWVLVGALDWARLILREDARSSNGGAADHLGEPWALPLQEVKLSSFLSADSLAQDGQEEAYLSGLIVDAQAKINLTNLVVDGKLSPATYLSLYRLYQKLQLPLPELAQWTAQWLASEPQPQSAVANVAQSGAMAAPLRPQQIQQLTWLSMSPRSLQALEPFLTILPVRTVVNLNTASAEVIYAVIPDLDFAQTQQFLVQRAQSPPNTLTQAAQLLGINANTQPLDSTQLGINSSFFEVSGRLRLGEWTLSEQSLVQRSNNDVKALRRHKL